MEDMNMTEQTTGTESGMANRSRMLAVRHVAQMLGVHESTVRMWADSGILDSYRIGPRQDRRIPIEAVMRALESAKHRMNQPVTVSHHIHK